MVSILQRLAVVTWLFLVVAVALRLGSDATSALAWAGLGVLFTGHAIVLALEFAMMARVNRRTPEHSATRTERLKAWWAETIHAPKVFGWWQPFQCCRWPNALAPARTRQRGVVLVHGFLCNRGLWQPWLARMHRRHTPFVAVNLEPPWAPIDTYAPIIEQAVRRLSETTGLAPVVVAHSMGGLAVRHWWQTTQADRVHHLITLGTPHHGTWMARFGRLPNIRQMGQGSPWLERLAEAEGPERRARTTCFYSPCDNIVFPAASATLPGADNRRLCGVAHVQMAVHPEPWKELLRRLRAKQEPRSP